MWYIGTLYTIFVLFWQILNYSKIKFILNNDIEVSFLPFLSYWQTFQSLMSSVDEVEGELGTLLHIAVGNANW